MNIKHKISVYSGHEWCFIQMYLNRGVEDKINPRPEQRLQFKPVVGCCGVMRFAIYFVFFLLILFINIRAGLFLSNGFSFSTIAISTP